LRRDAPDADGIICDIGRSLDLLKTVLAEFDGARGSQASTSLRVVLRENLAWSAYDAPLG
jgi:hypothetical protein